MIEQHSMDTFELPKNPRFTAKNLEQERRPRNLDFFSLLK